MQVATAAAQAQTLTLQGQLVVRLGDGAGDSWLLRPAPPPGSGSVLAPLPYALLGGQPRNSAGQHVPPGRMVQLACTPPPDGSRACASSGPASPLGGPAAPPAAPSVSTASVPGAASPSRLAAPLRLRLLVLSVALAGECRRNSTPVATLQALFLGPGGYASFLGACSFGRMTVDTAASRVMGVTVACTAPILACNTDHVAAAADAAVVKSMGAAFLAGFSHVSYVIPAGVKPQCRWEGLADLPGSRTWYAPEQAVFLKGVVLQEWMHNFGLYHSWRNGIEYLDYSTAMGMGDVCLSAPELRRMGWATPRAELGRPDLPVNTFRAFALAATAAASTGSFLRLTPAWMGTAYSQLSLDDDPLSSLLAAVGPRGSLDLAAFKTLLRVGALALNGTAVTGGGTSLNLPPATTTPRPHPLPRTKEATFWAGVSLCSAECYMNPQCTYFFTTTGGACALMRDLLLGPDFQTAAPNPNPKVDYMCVLTGNAPPGSSYGTLYGFNPSALPATAPGPVLWLPPPPSPPPQAASLARDPPAPPRPRAPPANASAEAAAAALERELAQVLGAWG
ncbi:hypothetical protein HYH03_002401 [Edaphochlamys debaryana]|uniref:Peptidase M11 gametolysin domain-containing protein n=1 Tax=Edaphochlamys debaryana TaxID=47281 RepID=A0A835YD06_9CHLO|nr:hypothetical protein HYH03_002401 [Edaphochlamys debaryana]|eukprot:KAG2499454.1 hypothetical protein HYH03_002401 [Edaphochlamys debaryana]